MNNQWTRAYKKATNKEAWFLEQIWNGRQFWYPTGNYVKWLEHKLLLLKSKEKVKRKDFKFPKLKTGSPIGLTIKEKLFLKGGYNISEK